MIRTVVHFVVSDISGGCEEVLLLLLADLEKDPWPPVLFSRTRPAPFDS